MMYSNHFVMCVLVDGQPVSELANGVVKLPFGTEYALRFRNKHNRRAVVKIYIDGENVGGEGGYVVRANDYVDIKRHHDVDRSFKFVALDSPDAVDHGKNGPNEDKVKGTIEARFYLEKEHKPVYRPIVHEHHWHHHDYRYRSPFPTLGNPYPTYGTCSAGGQTKGFTDMTPQVSYNSENSTSSGPSGSSGGDIAQFKRIAVPQVRKIKGESVNLSMNDSMPESIHCSMPPAPVLKDGCTVEGNVTGQNFHSVWIDLEETYTSLKLFLQGHDQPEEAMVKAPKSKTKSPKVVELETENEELRRKLAELENLQLKEKLAAAEKKPAPKKKVAPKAKAKPKVKAKPE